ncbi:hypothetical protein M407DRAFT_157362 [Tulasnella calospora MUT 4182]|nr:hypothetical protein M407DRAFT_157362 [Tulasnella calospora MUT 4182]
MYLKLEVDAEPPYHGLLEEAGPFFHHWASSFGPNTGWDVQVTSRALGSTTGMLSEFAVHFPMALTLTITLPAIIPFYVGDPPLTLFDSTGEPKFPCLEQLEIWYCKAFAQGIFQTITKRMIREDTQSDGVNPLSMCIKLPRDMDESERVELTWLEDHLAGLTLEGTDTILYGL